MPYVARFSRENSEYFLDDSVKYILRVNMNTPIISQFDTSEDSDPDEICIPGTQRGNRGSTSIQISVLDGHNTFMLRNRNQCSRHRNKIAKPIVFMRPGQSWRPKSKQAACIVHNVFELISSLKKGIIYFPETIYFRIT